MKGMIIVVYSPHIFHHIENLDIFSSGIFSHLYYKFIGYHEKANQNQVIRKAPDFYMVLYCAAGSGYYHCGEHQFEISSGDLFFCFADTFTAYGTYDADPWSIYWADIKGDQVADLFLHYHITPENPVFNIGINNALTDRFHEILKTYYTNCNDNTLFICQSMFYELLFFIFKLIYYPHTLTGRMEELLQYIDYNIASPLSLDQLARQANISQYHLARLFKAATGIPPHQYIMDKRLLMAQELLTSTDKSIKEIASLTGIGDSLYLSNQFKKKNKCSPTEYRKKYNGLSLKGKE